MPARRTAASTLTSATALALLTGVAVVGAATGASAGSDAPTPYRVTSHGLELPAGDVLDVHDHVNVRFTTPAGPAARTVHVEGPGTVFGDLAGASTLTWDRAGVPADACVTWVQVAGYDEHFGEGGQAPVCRTPVAPPAPTPAPPAPAPVAPPAVPPAATAPASPAPVPAPAAPATPAPAAPSDDVAPAPDDAPVAPAPAAPAPAPTTTERAEVLAEGPAPTPAARAQVLAATDERSDVLAATGTPTGVLLAAGVAALGLGAGLVGWRRRAAAHR